ARELLAALPRLQRTPVGRLLSMARTAMRLREAGRVGMLRAADVARHAARALGEDLARAGVLEEPGHVYHLSWDEVTSPPADAGDLIAQRQASFAWYQGVELPQRWAGDVEPIEVAGDDPAVLTGIGVSSGVVEGTARVISGPDDSFGLEPGEILVCRTTDPSCATYILVADGVVIDVGGPLSHGAIVAREMGIPCVINVGCGTRVLKSGDRIRVDGDAGEVIRL
ncbi:MAG: PEP-utilizing enzyme, partial [Acidimicrobiia bacterium]